MTRDPVVGRIGGVVVAPCTRTARGLLSELPLGPQDGMPEACVASFDNLHVVSRQDFRVKITQLSSERMNAACRVMNAALGCL